MIDLLTITTPRTGRVLMHVEPSFRDGLHSYTGHGIGGIGTKPNCLRVARYVLMDSPRATVTGDWAKEV